MKKLSDIPKRNIYQVPEGYFEKLPGVIQARVAEKQGSALWSWSWGLSLRFALPILCLVVAGIFWFRTTSHGPLDLQAELSKFQPEQLQEYLDHHDVLSENDLSTEDLVESVKWSKGDVDRLDSSVYAGYGSSKELEKILDEYDSEL